MKRHARTLLYLLPLAVALCSLLVYVVPGPMAPDAMHLLPMAPR